MLILLFLSSGLFLGWSLGANDASNIFGAAVSTRMVKFRTAALIASIFVIIGAVVSGSGASHTLGELGSVNMIAGAFMVALAAGLTVLLMTRLGIPVSASQAIVGAIIGWNFFSGTLTDWTTLIKITAAWVAGPLLAAVFAYLLYRVLTRFTHQVGIHLFRLDAYTRVGLLLITAFGAYALGANNIANVMGVFVPVTPFRTFSLGSMGEFTGIHQLFLLGGIAIAVGIFTYSKRVIQTVGKDLLRLTPQAALVVVLAESLVLFLFASRNLHDWLIASGLPALPLVPISSSQAVVGAVLGIGFAHGGRNIRLKVLGRIAFGWITTPALALALTFVTLFFLQNVFDQQVYYPVRYRVDAAVTQRLTSAGVAVKDDLSGNYENGRLFNRRLRLAGYGIDDRRVIMEYAELLPAKIQAVELLQSKVGDWFTEQQISQISALSGRQFKYKWQLEEELVAIGIELSGAQMEYLYRYFRLPIHEAQGLR